MVWWLRAEEPATLAADFADLAVELRLPGQRRARPARRHRGGEALARAQRALAPRLRQRARSARREGLPPLRRDGARPRSPRATRAGGAWRCRCRSAASCAAATRWRCSSSAAAPSKAARREATAREPRHGARRPPARAGAGGRLHRRAPAPASREYLARFRERRAELMKRGARGRQRRPRWRRPGTSPSATSRPARPRPASCSTCAPSSAPDDIPRDALRRGAARFPPALGAGRGRPVRARRGHPGAAPLLAHRRPRRRALVHRLVQAAVRDRLGEDERRSVGGDRGGASCPTIFPDEPDDPEERGGLPPLAPARPRGAGERARRRGPPARGRPRACSATRRSYQHVFGFDRPAREMLEPRRCDRPRPSTAPITRTSPWP